MLNNTNKQYHKTDLAHLKIAIVCDWLVNPGGAEKVLEQLLICFPHAEIFACVDFLAHDKRSFVAHKTVKTSFIQTLPFAKKHYRNYIWLMPLAIEQFNLTTYDVILSSSHAIAKGVITSSEQLHICYCHSPMRYAWDMQHQYLANANLEHGIKSWIARVILHKLRLWDLRTINSVNYFIANSNFIAKRIQKFYARQATVIYPPVNVTIDAADINTSREDFYLTVSRMVPYKRIDIILDAFLKDSKRKLIVIGDGPLYKALLKQVAHAQNIQLLGYQSDNIIHDYFRRAKGFIFAAEEDFGIVPVEAMAYGLPVIAYNKGGVIESMNITEHFKTGILFDQQDSNSLLDALEMFEKNITSFTAQNCINNASRFSANRFRQEIIDFVTDKINNFGKSSN